MVCMSQIAILNTLLTSHVTLNLGHTHINHRYSAANLQIGNSYPLNGVTMGGCIHKLLALKKQMNKTNNKIICGT